MLPSKKTIQNRLRVTPEQAAEVRTILEAYDKRFVFRRPHPVRTFNKISDVIGGFGHDEIPPGNNERSPGIDFVDRGDTYAETVLFVNGKFRIGTWGEIVEKGSYN